MTRGSWTAAAVVLVGGAGLAMFSLVGDSADGGSIARVARDDFEISVEATGKLEAAVSLEIGPPSVRDFWNYNLTWMIPEGRTVTEGDVVARFDATQIEERLREHRAELEMVQQEKEKEKRNLEVELKRLQLDLVRAEGEMKTLALDLAVPEQLLASIEVAELKLEGDLAGKRVAFLQEKIEFEQELVRAKLELLDVKREYEEGKIRYNETAKEKFDVKAPVSGIVVYMPKQNGDRWEIGENVWMLAKILEVADVTTLQVEADVLEVDASAIAPGQEAEISVDAVPGMILESHVAEIGRIVHERSMQDPSKVFDTILPLAEFDGEVLRPGMGVQVRIRTKLVEDALSVPLAAIRSTAEGTWVDVIGSDGPSRRAVTLGGSNADRVVVLDGLEEGERVRLASNDV